MEKVEVGGLYEGKVLRLKPFGAIVSLPDNTQGLVHISHIANSYVQNVNDFLAVGDIVKVKVLSNDPASGKISLSIKDAAPAPQKADNHYDHEQPRRSSYDAGPTGSFEDKFKDWLKASNERQAGLNKRNKRR